MSKNTSLATIGYEQATQAAVIDKLKAAGVEVLIDVRAVAASRRAGFSKTILANSLAEHGIDYVHLRALGTPKAGRDAARHGRIAEMHAIYEKQLELPEAQFQLAKAADIASKRKAALLCFEADPTRCHREIVAERLRAAHGFERSVVPLRGKGDLRDRGQDRLSANTLWHPARAGTKSATTPDPTFPTRREGDAARFISPSRFR